MRSSGTTQWKPMAGIALLAIALLLPLHTRAERSSELSRWLNQEAIPEVAEVLSRHPRFSGQPVHIVPGAPSELADAVVTILHSNFDASENIATVKPPALRVPVAPGSVDDLDCVAPATPGTGLQVSVQALSARRGRVELALFDSGDSRTYWRRWQWQGNLSQAERKALSGGTHAAVADGSLKMPWPSAAVQEAAWSLSSALVCDLRAQLHSRVDLQFSEAGDLPPGLGDVRNASRHLLGNFREIGLAGTAADFQVDVRVETFDDNIWQLWLTGTPRSGGYDPVQAVTYIRYAEETPVDSHAPRAVVPVPRVAASAPGDVSLPDDAAYPGDAALQYLDVRMLDVVQTDKPFSSAELQVKLQLVNRAEWPIQYYFTLSGGHYLNCVPGPEFYRHDRYGYVEGELPPGESLVRQLVVDGVQHRPTPWFGPRKCAGFRDLEGFENFASKGYKVTEFVRWSM